MTAPADRQATPETRALFVNLRARMGAGLMIGHQQPTAEGVGWINQPNRSDIYSVAGTLPAVWGWDFSDIHSISAGRLTNIEPQIRDAFGRGAVNTLSWHIPNPVTGGKETDTTPAVARILPGGDLHGVYRAWLDELARFANDLRGVDGQPIPLVFRPFHERDGGGFWWGSPSSTTADFVALWRFTVDYLRYEKKVHTFLYAYSPKATVEKPLTRAAYFAAYPGDDYVDVLGLDLYDTTHRWNPFAQRFPTVLRDMLHLIVDDAQARGKVAALTETGQPGVRDEKWWTNSFLLPIKNDPTARCIVYALFWRNHDRKHHFVPYPGHGSVPDFLKMRDDAFSLFLDDLPNLYVLLPTAARRLRETLPPAGQGHRLRRSAVPSLGSRDDLVDAPTGSGREPGLSRTTDSWVKSGWRSRKLAPATSAGQETDAERPEGHTLQPLAGHRLDRVSPDLRNVHRLVADRTRRNQFIR